MTGEVSLNSVPIGTAVGGPVGTLGGAALAGAAGGAANNLTGYAIDLATKPSVQFDANRFIFDTGISGLTGLIPFPGTRSIGISVGRNSFDAIFKQITTKAINGSIARITTTTAGKMFIGDAVHEGAFQGAVTSSSAGDLYDLWGTGDDFSSAPQGVGGK